MGIGVGLVADEVGLLLLKLSYWDMIAFAIAAGGGLTHYTLTLFSSWRAGLHDFRFVDRYQFLALLGILFGLTGFLFFDRPVRMIVEAASVGSWLVSIILVAKYGRKHFFLLRHAPLDYGPKPRSTNGRDSLMTALSPVSINAYEYPRSMASVEYHN